MTAEPDDTDGDVARIVRNKDRPTASSSWGNSGLLLLRIQVPFLPSSLIQSKRHYGGLSKAAALWEWGQQSRGRLRSPLGVRRHLHRVWYGSDSSGMNRVSTSGVAETVGDKILATGEKGYKYVREAEKEPLALDWN